MWLTCEHTVNCYGDSYLPWISKPSHMRSNKINFSFGMVFGKIISIVAGALIPIITELFLLFPVSQSVKFRVKTFGPLLFNIVVYIPKSRCIICFDRCRWLRMTHFFQCYANWNSTLCIEIYSTSFRFIHRAYHILDCFTFDIDGTIDHWFGNGRWVGRVLSQMGKPCITTLRFW